jgi:hypothetical protein
MLAHGGLSLYFSAQGAMFRDFVRRMAQQRRFRRACKKIAAESLGDVQGAGAALLT